MTLDFALEICTKNASGTKTGDSVPLGNVLNNLLIITWRSITTLPSPITEIILCLPALSLNVRYRQSAGVKSVLHRKHQQRASKKQWKHITGFPKYMTVNLKTRLLSRTPQNTTHSADTFLNNDVNVLIYRVVWVCLSLCVCVWFPSLNVSRDLAGSSVQQIGVGGVSNLPQHLLTGCLTLKSSAPPFSKRMCIKPPKLSF